MNAPLSTKDKKRLYDRAYKEANREKIREQSRLYRAAHPEYRAKAQAYNKQYRVDHRKELLAYFKAYNEAHYAEKRAKDKAYRAANRQVINERNKAYDFRHREEKLAYFKAYNRAHRQDKLDGHLRRYYGISLEERNALLQAQGNVCAVCRTAEWGYQGPHVDHDHKTKRVRGILCSRCNLVLGRIEDSPEIAQGILNYLHSAQPNE